MFTIFGKRWRNAETKLADAITRLAGSMFFVYVHIAWFVLWLLFANRIGDAFPFGLLTMVVSLEAIFLATFIMVAQNRQAEIAEQRAIEEDKEEEETEERLEDIAEEFDTLQKDLDEMKQLIEKMKKKQAERTNIPLDLPQREDK